MIDDKAGLMMKRIWATAILCFGLGMASTGYATYSTQLNQSSKMVTSSTPMVVSTSLSETLKPSELRTWGKKGGAVRLYLFSSFTCPHCSTFHAEVLPEIQKKFIKTGKAQLIAVDMPYDSAAITATMMSRCIEPKLYEEYTHTLFQNQTTWAYASKPRALMEGYARALGADVEKLDLCVRDYDLRKTVVEQRNNLSTLYKVTGMPTLVMVTKGRTEKISGTDTPVIIERIQSITELK